LLLVVSFLHKFVKLLLLLLFNDLFGVNKFFYEYNHKEKDFEIINNAYSMTDITFLVLL
jgi:hypothetical protein